MAEDVFGIVGTAQGPYQVESVVAEGGFGVVYRAYHEAFRAPVALKCLKVPGKLNQKSQAEFLERFREEAEVMFRLSASIPAVVRPLHVDVIATSAGDFAPFMAMEWLEGETLDVLVAKRVREGRQPPTLKRLVRMLAPVARALERAHNFPGPEGTVSIVHCDLKPENIFLTEIDGISSAKILDFGIAKVRSAATQMVGRVSQTEAQGTAFTPGYAAPEQWLPKRYGQTGPWTDVFGMAVTLVEAALGRPLIDGDHAAMMGMAIDEKRRPTPRSEGLQVSDEVEEIFLRAMAVDPRRRQADVGLLWDELERAFGLDSTSASVVRRDHRVEGAGPAVREEHIDLGRSGSSLPPPSKLASTWPPPGGSQAPLSAPPARLSQAPRLSIPPHPALPSDLQVPKVPTLGGRSESSRMSHTPISQREPMSRPRTTGAHAERAPSALSFGGEVELHEDAAHHPSIALDLDPLALSSGPRSGRVGFDGRALAPSPYRSAPVHRGPSGPDLKSRLGAPLRLAIGGIVLAAAEQVYVQALDGEAIALGPVRLVWVASAVAVLGIAMVLFKLFWPSEE